MTAILAKVRSTYRFLQAIVEASLRVWSEERSQITQTISRTKWSKKDKKSKKQQIMTKRTSYH